MYDIESVNEFLITEQELMFSEIIKEIFISHENGLNEAIICEFTLEVNDNLIVIDSKKETWVYSLSIALDYYESVENFEECDRINKLINQIR